MAKKISYAPLQSWTRYATSLFIVWVVKVLNKILLLSVKVLKTCEDRLFSGGVEIMVMFVLLMLMTGICVDDNDDADDDDDEEKRKINSVPLTKNIYSIKWSRKLSTFAFHIFRISPLSFFKYANHHWLRQFKPLKVSVYLIHKKPPNKIVEFWENLEKTSKSFRFE